LTADGNGRDVGRKEEVGRSGEKERLGEVPVIEDCNTAGALSAITRAGDDVDILAAIRFEVEATTER
jgi:hypothetical protein